GNHGVELLADLEALRALLVAVAAKVAALDEAGRSILADLHVKACILDGTDRNGNRLALLDTGRGSAAGSGALAAAALELLHAGADALLFDVDVEDLGLHSLGMRHLEGGGGKGATAGGGAAAG